MEYTHAGLLLSCAIRLRFEFHHFVNCYVTIAVIIEEQQNQQNQQNQQLVALFNTIANMTTFQLL